MGVQLFYTGIGSRTTPPPVLTLMSALARGLERKGFHLYSGGADGADSAFEKGVLESKNKSIFLPWPGFNNHKSPLNVVCCEAITLAKKYHPSPQKLSQAALKLMARNGYQVLGPNLKTPVKFVLCWTKDGKDTGGTGQAIRIAWDYEIPVFNLYFEDALKSFRDFLTIWNAKISV